jgi:NAD(P)-dependent dehydrogenase (short-subunit alcohol dehydrogenase family)
MSDQVNTDRPMNWMMNSGLKGLTALVVGGGSGMGAATALAFAANGGQVVVTDINADAAAAIAEQIVSDGGEAISAKLDISSQDDIDAVLANILERFGKLDTVINTSALVIPDALEDVKMDDWRKCFAVNVEGPLLLARTCLPHLQKSPAASIINVTSLAGIHGYSGGGPYGPSKAALIILTHQMANEWATLGIRVNAVNPGTVVTPMMRETVRPEVLEFRRKSIPMQRLGEPDEVANTILFLVSPAASFITGQVINVDGGFSHAMFLHRLGQNHASLER